MRHAVHIFKYRNLRALARPLGEMLAGHLQSNPLPADTLVAVPMHPRHLRERGYNQSALLAQELSRATGLPCDTTTLVRRRDTPAQARTPTAEQRLSNVAGAFSVHGRPFKGKRVVLVDDVCTSGATMDSCSIALKRAGATSVWGLTLAKET